MSRFYIGCSEVEKVYHTKSIPPLILFGRILINLIFICIILQLARTYTKKDYPITPGIFNQLPSMKQMANDNPWSFNYVLEWLKAQCFICILCFCQIAKTKNTSQKCTQKNKISGKSLIPGDNHHSIPPP